MLGTVDILLLLLFGTLGALTKDILKDNKLVLPKKKDGALYLGCLGGLIIGAMAGYLVDNDPVTAFLGGFGGTQIIENLVVNGRKRAKTKKKTFAVK